MKMSTNRIIFATLAILYFVGSRICKAQNTREDYLRAHNAARAQVGVGPLRWDENVAAYARNYANQRRGDCKLVHSSGPYGENLAWSSGNMNVASAVKMWVDEKRFYNYQSNSCVGGVCGHYTQVVWRNSVRLGCARLRCNTGGTFITCNYDPPGNYIGQRPYSDLTEGHSSSS